MPYIQVWMDDCDGTCASAEDAREAIKEAIAALRRGDDATALDALTDIIPDADKKAMDAREREFARLYDSWRKVPMPRPEFLAFAHGQRKLTVA